MWQGHEVLGESQNDSQNHWGVLLPSLLLRVDSLVKESPGNRFRIPTSPRKCENIVKGYL